MSRDFEFNGVKLSDIGAVITEKPSYTLSFRELDFTSLPGKSGDFITDKQRFKNLAVSYKISSIPSLCDYNAQLFAYRLSEWLLTSYDYKILRDTNNIGYFRKAVCTEISNPTVEASGMVWTTVTFNCEPFLYSENGTESISYSATSSNSYAINATLLNQEMWDSEPIIEIIPTGAVKLSITINDITVTFTESFSNAVTIDVPERNIYYSQTLQPCNNIVSAMKLPLLKSGENTIITIPINTSNDYVLKITPNWRRL